MFQKQTRYAGILGVVIKPLKNSGCGKKIIGKGFKRGMKGVT